MSRGLWIGIMIGCIWSGLDAAILWWIIKLAGKEPERAGRVLLIGFGGRYLLTFGIIAGMMLIDGRKAAGVVIALIAQKGILAVVAARRK